jgi:isopentenyl-diphosphate delta-isomerase type 1
LPGDDLVDLVDAHDAVVGSSTIKKCLEKALLHRAVAVLVMRSNGRFVLQQRSKKDRWQPGLWTISSTGHVMRGEAYAAAARRELGEELGIEGTLIPVRKYRLPAISVGNLTEYEWVSLFTCRTDSRCKIDRTELESVKEVTEEELRSMLGEGPLTPDAKIILADYLARKP